jgi:putative redox protein
VKVSARRRKGYAHSLTAGHHTLIADEPPDAGGTDTGPRPTALLALSLAACTAITIEMYADRKGWELGDVDVEVDYDLNPGKVSRFQVVMKLAASLSDEQLERLRTIAGKCPVHRTLTGDVEIIDEIERVEASRDEHP